MYILNLQVASWNGIGKKKTRIWSSGILLKVSGIPLTIESGIHRESAVSTNNIENLTGPLVV